MSIVSTVSNILSGNFLKEARGMIKDYFPPSMSDKEKAELELKINDTLAEKEQELRDAALKDQEMYNTRIKELEGTASDLKSIPIVGPILLMLRGAQRPMWGFATMFIDFKVFSNSWKLDVGSTEMACFYAVNLLVLSFLFGERALKNISPILEKLLDRVIGKGQ